MHAFVTVVEPELGWIVILPRLEPRSTRTAQPEAGVTVPPLLAIRAIAAHAARLHVVAPFALHPAHFWPISSLTQCWQVGHFHVVIVGASVMPSPHASGTS